MLNSLYFTQPVKFSRISGARDILQRFICPHLPSMWALLVRVFKDFYSHVIWPLPIIGLSIPCLLGWATLPFLLICKHILSALGPLHLRLPSACTAHSPSRAHSHDLHSSPEPMGNVSSQYIRPVNCTQLCKGYLHLGHRQTPQVWGFVFLSRGNVDFD